MAEMRETGSILISGVGGQGILLASEVTASALIGTGLDVKKSEVHGMAQRGGSVVAHLRYGPKVYSPVIEEGTADILVGFELIESVRYMPYLHAKSKVMVNTQRILPPSVARGVEIYPERVLEEFERRGVECYAINAVAIAREVGEERAVNMILVGALSTFLPPSCETFLDAIRSKVKKNFIDINIEAFMRGRQITGGKTEVGGQ